MGISLPLLTTDHRPLTTLFWVAALLQGGALADAQAPTPEMPAASTPSKTSKVADLTNRYLFSERYAGGRGGVEPGAIGAYRVGVVELARDTVDTPQGAPRRAEATRQSIYVERPAELDGLAGVAASSRTFERFRARPEDPSRTMGPRPLEGLSALVRPKVGELPLVLALTEGRRLTGYEYEVAARQVFVPQLSAALPMQSVRLGDTWRVPRRGAQAILGDPGLQGDTLVGKLVELRKEVDGPRMVAQLAISGKAAGASGDSTVNAEILFTFRPESSLKAFPAGSSSLPRPTSDVIEARGAITELRLARSTTAELPGPGRLRFRSHREVTLHRQLGLAPEAAGPAPPASAPAATEANSWLAYLEPGGRFSFRHPQDLLPPERGPVAPLEADAATLVRARREGTDLLRVEFSPKALAPEDLKRKLAAKWALTRQEVLTGAEEWLPEADWPKTRVHRIEAAVKAADPKAGAGADPGTTRIHFDGYLIQFGQSASILAIATTSRDAVAPFRREVEQVLRSIEVGPGRPAKD